MMVRDRDRDRGLAPSASWPSARMQTIGLVGWLALTFVFAAIGAVASAQAPSFYAALQRPGWAPPAWLFGPVWSALYTAMAVAAWLVWRERGARAAAVPLALYLVQLAVNSLWTWLYFGWRQGGWALAEIALLLVLIVATIDAFRRVRPLAAALLLPYLAWVGFAAALTFATWRLNPGLLG